MEGFLNYIKVPYLRYFIHGHQHLSETTRIGATTVIGVFGETALEIED